MRLPTHFAIHFYIIDESRPIYEHKWSSHRADSARGLHGTSQTRTQLNIGTMGARSGSLYSERFSPCWREYHLKRLYEYYLNGALCSEQMKFRFEMNPDSSSAAVGVCSVESFLVLCNMRGAD
ncbi:hypothetical protein B5X24_HaOG204536 [Helicoverpa armigera]|uniref:Uncharacterized protein n=1 Tax=Helicoverpa armigera TaxID=29058 RepID=A0A2W1BS54_HELAM|nr:hypothetical protein B5X24_HaOG204536 [Helicoverpa armigera]